MDVLGCVNPALERKKTENKPIRSESVDTVDTVKRKVLD